VDAAPQTKLKSTVTAAQAKVTAFQSVNTKLAALQTAATNLQSAGAWSAAKATTSGDGIAATADPSAAAASLSFRVTALATARSVISDPISATADLATIKDKLSLPMDVLRDGAIVGRIDASSGPLEAVVASINKIQGLGLNAVAIKMGDGNYRVQITSTTTGDKAGNFKLVPWKSGQASSYSVTDATNEAESSKFVTSVAASNAKIELPVADVAGVSQKPITVSSQSNTFSGLMTGVSITATKVTTTADPVTVSVATDTSKVTASVQALVDAANAALDEIKSQSKAGVVSATGALSGAGVLRGEGLLRDLSAGILTQVTTALGGTQSAATYGVQTTRDGKLTFSADTFSKAYAADAVKVQKAFSPQSADASVKPADSDGLADRLARVAKAATDPDVGSLTKAVTGQTDRISDLAQRIADWDVRLSDKKAHYQKYYSSLEVSLGKLQSQSKWLSGQLASLGGGSQG
jgi:flagellar hook-associated protein 2